jgi:GntR family transcriptional regulator
MDVITVREAGPLYLQIRSRIKTNLEQGIWKPGELLPTESELSRSFNVSPGTVRQALSTLVHEGLLTRRAGKGTFVARIDGWRSFDRFFGFRGGAGADEKFAPKILVLEARVTESVHQEIRTKLSITDTERVFLLRRALYQDGLAVCVSLSFLPYDLVPGIEFADLTQRMYPLLERDFGMHVIRAEEVLGAGAADEHSAKALDIAQSSPVIMIDRTVHTYKDRVLEYRKTVGRSDTFRYRIRLR